MIVPDGLPVLSPGYHSTPHHGACVMEYVSLLAGLEWSDRPKCTDMSLAMASQRLNDDLGGESRQRLLPLIPRIMRITPERVRAFEVQAAVMGDVSRFVAEELYLNNYKIDLQSYKIRRDGWLHVSEVSMRNPNVMTRQYHDHSDTLLDAVIKSIDQGLVDLFVELLDDLESRLRLPRLDAPGADLMSTLHTLHDVAKRKVDA